MKGWEKEKLIIIGFYKNAVDNVKKMAGKWRNEMGEEKENE